MASRCLSGLALSLAAVPPAVAAGTDPPPWAIDRTYAQTSPILVLNVPLEERKHNEQVVLDFYYKVAHAHD